MLSFLLRFGGHAGIAIMPILNCVRNDIMCSNPGAYANTALLLLKICMFMFLVLHFNNEKFSCIAHILPITFILFNITFIAI